MTPDILEYLLRATTIWSVLLAFYLLVRRRTDFRFQRVVLLGGWLFGLLIPLLPKLKPATVFPAVNLPTIRLMKTVAAATTEVGASAPVWTMMDLLPWLYVAGVLFFGARTLVRWRFVKRCLADGQRTSFAGFTVVTSPKAGSPFAAWGFVFLPEGLDPDLTSTALLHETAHLRSRHHYDKLVMTLCAIALWCHPLVWVYRRLLATVHEYEADAVVLKTVPAKTYGQQLISCALTPAYGLGLFSSPLKKRIDMITSNPVRKNRLFPFVVLVLLLSGLVVACSDVGENGLTPEYEVVAGEEISAMVPALYKDSEDLNASMKAYLTDIYQEIRYPAEARKSYTTGKFRAKITLGTDGKIETVDISPYTEELAGGPPAAETIVIIGYAEDNTLKSAAPQTELLTKEIDRIVNLFDNWQPAVRNGRRARNTINLDFYFRLEE